jgi:aminoglycoside phosphotransferase (APT) family kinase protein
VALRVEPLAAAGAHINDSYVVSSPGSSRRLLLQRLNRTVFSEPRRVMENVVRVTRHIGGPLLLVPAADGRDWLEDDNGDVWRAYRYIEGAQSYQQPRSAAQAFAAARAFGEFQRRLADLPGPPLHETIPGFHDTPRRFAALERAVDRDPAGRAASARHEITAVLRHHPRAGALMAAGLPRRVVHNDAKIANLLFDAGDTPICVVDLDTVMPGLALWDFGDLARSAATRAAEDETDLSRVTVEPDLFEALARGYLEGTGDLLDTEERRLLVTAAQVITLEQGVRFLTDYLEGDRYYRIARPAHNLERCRNQLHLFEQLVAGEAELSRRAR